MEQTVIELIHLTKKFGELVAVNDVTLTIPRGEFFAMLGPNAAGKTTTLKILAGLMKPTAGTAIRFANAAARGAAAARLRPRFSISLRQAYRVGIFPLHRPALSHARHEN
jgi:ABC-type multidrug transport system ATPase subunit